jgi:tetratricopeptide (TPR) repeat protein
VQDPADVAALALAGRLSDGLVVYVNGKEAGRLHAGAPGAVLPHTATADGGDKKPWLRHEVPLDAAALRAGENVLALQALNNRLDSSSFFLLPALQARTHRIDQRLPGLDARLEVLRVASQGPSDRLRALYFEGRLCEARGRPDEARARYEEVLAADRSRPEPFIRLAACLAATEGAGAAETALRQALESGPRKSIMLWEEWFRVAAAGARRSAADLLRDFPCSPQSLEGASWGLPSDLAWVVTELAGRAVIRINCGGSAFRADDGADWAGDRFHTGGRTRYFSALAMKPRPALKDPALYHTARQFDGSSPAVAAYRISLPRGRYEVRLHFIEGAREETGSRVFSVMLEGKVVAPSLVPGSAGYGVPRRDAYMLRVDDGALDIAFGRVADDPQIAGIEVEARGP